MTSDQRRLARCQIPSGRCEIPPAYKLTLQSAGGLIWIEASCRSHANPRVDQIRSEGGKFVAVEELPSRARQGGTVSDAP